MASILCAHCKSAETITGLDRVTCLDCGEHTHSDGSAVPPAEKYLVPHSAGAGKGM